MNLLVECRRRWPAGQLNFWSRRERVRRHDGQNGLQPRPVDHLRHLLQVPTDKADPAVGQCKGPDQAHQGSSAKHTWEKSAQLRQTNIVPNVHQFVS